MTSFHLRRKRRLLPGRSLNLRPSGIPSSRKRLHSTHVTKNSRSSAISTLAGWRSSPKCPSSQTKLLVHPHLDPLLKDSETLDTLLHNRFLLRPLLACPRADRPLSLCMKKVTGICGHQNRILNSMSLLASSSGLVPTSLRRLLPQ